MTISEELSQFYSNWIAKADGYDTDVIGCLDRFFSLYVIFNRLYAEATFSLVRAGSLNLSGHFPDRKASQEYLLQFIGAHAFLERLQADPGIGALNEICACLRDARFYVKLHMVTGERQPTEDQQLLCRLESSNEGHRAGAILETLYAIRCNTFHGHKGCQPVQIEILRPVNTILKRTIQITYEKLQSGS
jgi:hypothetical protein